MKCVSKSDKDTVKFGGKFARTLTGGEVVLLVGDLGAGKTTFVKGVAAALGVSKVVNSPTFVIMKVYKTKKGEKPIKNLVHVDAYRGIDLGELQNIGVVEYFGRKDSVCFIEWGGFLEDYFKKSVKNGGAACKVIKVRLKNISEKIREISY